MLMNLILTGLIFADNLKTNVGSSIFQLDHDWFIQQDLVIRTAASGGGTLLSQGVDYTIGIEAIDLSSRVSTAVGSTRNVFHTIQITNVTYQTGNLYISGKFVGDSISATDLDWSNIANIPTATGSVLGALSSTDWTTFNSKQNALGFTPENISNKSTDASFTANSDTLYPTQKAVKSALASNLSFSQITVFPNNMQGLSSYGVKQFGTDLNAAWASIPRADDTLTQNGNDWVIMLPAGVYTPTSNNLTIYGTTITGSTTVYDFGYTYLPAINGQTITGPGIPVNTTISGQSFIAGGFFGTVSYTTGSNIVTGFSSTAALWVGQTVYSGSSQSYLPASRITAILPGGTSIQVSNNAVQSGTASMTTVGASSVTISHAATATASDVPFTVNVPLQVTGTTASSGSTVNNVSYVANAMIGQTVTGSGIQSGTTVTAISFSATMNLGTLTLSQPATASATVSLSFQIPSIFYCDMTKRKICTIGLGPVHLGRADAGSTYNSGGTNSTFWTPQPGTDHFIDFHLQPDVMFNSWSMRHGFSFCAGVTPHDDSNSTHFAYISKNRLTGTLRLLDIQSGNNVNQEYSFGDIEIFGNPGLMTYSVQTGTTTLGSTSITGLSTTGLMTGQALSGAGIPSNTFIKSITSSSALVITQPATAGGTPSLTFAYALPSTISVDASLLTQGTAQFFALYKSRIRGIFNGIYNGVGRGGSIGVELAYSENNEFSGLLTLLQYSHVEFTTFKGGMIWLANSVNFDDYGIYVSQITNSAMFDGGSNALRMDGSTNYWFVTNGAVLGTSTTKNILESLSPNASTSAVFNNGHLKSTQTTAPTATPNANAGTGATASVSHATDSAGSVSLTSGSAAVASGTQLTVSFNVAYNVVPIVNLTPTNANAAGNTIGVFVTSLVSGFSVNFTAAPITGTTYTWNYQIIETQ
jgi:hypothetical protein